MISRALDTTALEPMAVDAAGVAKLLNVSERHVWSLHASGRLPLPIRLGRAVRWRVSELEAWLRSGAVSRDAWQAMQAGSESR